MQTDPTTTAHPFYIYVSECAYTYNSIDSEIQNRTHRVFIRYPYSLRYIRFFSRFSSGTTKVSLPDDLLYTYICGAEAFGAFICAINNKLPMLVTYTRSYMNTSRALARPPPDSLKWCAMSSTVNLFSYVYTMLILLNIWVLHECKHS